MRQLVRALAHCHSRDIVHRDLKMENVLISKEMRVKLIDFGFSLQLPKENHILYDYCGTPSFIAPEVTQREGYYGKPADVWSLGVLIYRLATGNFPFSTTKEKTLLSKSIKSELKLPGEVTPELAALLTQMLSIDFWKRPTAE